MCGDTGESEVDLKEWRGREVSIYTILVSRVIVAEPYIYERGVFPVEVDKFTNGIEKKLSRRRDGEEEWRLIITVHGFHCLPLDEDVFKTFSMAEGVVVDVEGETVAVDGGSVVVLEGSIERTRWIHSVEMR